MCDSARKTDELASIVGEKHRRSRHGVGLIIGESICRHFSTSPCVLKNEKNSDARGLKKIALVCYATLRAIHAEARATLRRTGMKGAYVHCCCRESIVTPPRLVQRRGEK